jgi:hypothetical protein
VPDNALASGGDEYDAALASLKPQDEAESDGPTPTSSKHKVGERSVVA